MKKHLIVLFILVAISSVIFYSCEPFIQNQIWVKNLAAADVQLNLRGNVYSIPAGQDLVLNDFNKGTFAYETIYSIPPRAASSSTEGAISGNMILNAGTKVLLVYTSFFTDSTYTLTGSLTTTDDVNRVDPFANPGTP